MKTKKKSGKTLGKSGKSQGKIREFDGIKKVGTLIDATIDKCKCDVCILGVILQAGKSMDPRFLFMWPNAQIGMESLDQNDREGNEGIDIHMIRTPYTDISSI